MGIPPLSYDCKKWKVHAIVLHDSVLSTPSSSAQRWLLFVVAISRAEFSSTEFPSVPSLYFSLLLFVPAHGAKKREAPNRCTGVSSPSENTSKSCCSTSASPLFSGRKTVAISFEPQRKRERERERERECPPPLSVSRAQQRNPLF
ncbi:hypothetical protein KP509_19G003800 [Ceratopteris richardii]|uniref:Uncharacterized protein n=1 Tax=Ceratopteris richardii TaxID=49495 RepID=A0A8T2SLJ0_CERRI|nr:hypothetical protein KP509_19G003800 [Ceratopteris richardii]